MLRACIVISLVGTACAREPEPAPSEAAAPPIEPAAHSVDPQLEQLERAASCPWNEQFGTFDPCPEMNAWKAQVKTQQASEHDRGPFAASMLAAIRHPDPRVRLLAGRDLDIRHLADPPDGARQVVAQMGEEADANAAAHLARAFKNLDIVELGVVDDVLALAKTAPENVLVALLRPLGRAADRCPPCDELLRTVAVDPSRSSARATAVRSMAAGSITPEGCKLLVELITGDDETGPIVASLAFTKTRDRCRDQADAVVADLERRVATKEALTKRLLGVRMLLKNGILTPEQHGRVIAALRTYRRRAGTKGENKRVKDMIEQLGELPADSAAKAG